MLENASSVEVVHKAECTFTRLVQATVVEILNDSLDLIEESGTLHPIVTNFTKARP
jgi:hypothetical protein